MSADTERTFDETVVGAVECMIRRRGIDSAIEELQTRRKSGEDNGRVNEALAYLRRKHPAKQEEPR